jgi:alpha-beta hydrolase superfamily lysophospholipase/thiol-disulfide isomerase/thioredoxin
VRYKRFLAIGIAAASVSTTALTTLGAFAAVPQPSAQTTDRARIGDDIPFASWDNPRVKPWAVLLCLHGLSLHANSYADFGKQMSDIGVPTYAIDVRGFGSWQNLSDKQGSSVDFKIALDDVHSALESLRSAHPDLPIVLVGESMGGALALQAAAENQGLIDGLICSVPASQRTNQKMNTAKVAVGMLTAPNKNFNAGPSVVRAATQNQQLADTWSEDQMTRMKLSSKELLAFAAFTSKNAARAQEVSNISVLFLQGSKDRLIKPTATARLYNKLATKNKQFHMLNTEHLILEYNQFNQGLIDFISSWLQHNAVPAANARVASEDAKVPPESLVQAEGHLKIAEGYLKLGDSKTAEEHLLKVVNVARGSHFALDAEQLLCNLPEQQLADEITSQPLVTSSELKFMTHQQALANDKPSVLLFYADWIVGCKQVDEALQKALKHYSSKINFVRIDADDPNNEVIVKRYAVRPIPALLYLSADNKVVGYTFGYPGDRAIEAKIRNLCADTKSSP